MHGMRRATMGAIIAYGQTGTGKTHTMEGARTGPDRGIIPRAVGGHLCVHRERHRAWQQIPRSERPTCRSTTRCVCGLTSHACQGGSRCSAGIKSSSVMVRALAKHAACRQVISDLLKPDRQNLTIKEDRRRGVFVDGLSEWVVRSPHEVTAPPWHVSWALGCRHVDAQGPTFAVITLDVSQPSSGQSG